ncbi:VIT1/CCC1 transporter family protein [Streptomyces sp. P9-A2]|uniref:VIT1/CCC1 transporter family protein n=1 Tax=Streptomyces sp. P9-A2 TaxID=3072284 RepID=UPI002FCB23C3
MARQPRRRPAGREGEVSGGSMAARRNWLRAAVLGATGDRTALLTAGLAGLISGSTSMAAGEYVAVSSQRASEKAALKTERQELREQPEAEPEELTQLLQERGLSREVARDAAVQLTERDALRAHAHMEHGIDPDALANAWHAAGAIFLAFTVGALLPLPAIVLPPAGLRLPVTVVSTLAALVLTGWSSARLGGAAPGRAVLRNVAGGALAMGLTYLAGTLLGATGG